MASTCITRCPDPAASRGGKLRKSTVVHSLLRREPCQSSSSCMSASDHCRPSVASATAIRHRYCSTRLPIAGHVSWNPGLSSRHGNELRQAPILDHSCPAVRAHPFRSRRQVPRLAPTICQRTGQFSRLLHAQHLTMMCPPAVQFILHIRAAGTPRPLGCWRARFLRS